MIHVVIERPVGAQTPEQVHVGMFDVDSARCTMQCATDSLRLSACTVNGATSLQRAAQIAMALNLNSVRDEAGLLDRVLCLHALRRYFPGEVAAIAEQLPTLVDFEPTTAARIGVLVEGLRSDVVSAPSLD
jgi:hypothetical protein